MTLTPSEKGLWRADLAELCGALPELCLEADPGPLFPPPPLMRSGPQALQGLASDKVVCILASLCKGGLGSPEVEAPPGSEVEDGWMRQTWLNGTLTATGHSQLVPQGDALSSESEKKQSHLPPPPPEGSKRCSLRPTAVDSDPRPQSPSEGGLWREAQVPLS